VLLKPLWRDMKPTPASEKTALSEIREVAPAC